MNIRKEEVDILEKLVDRAGGPAEFLVRLTPEGEYIVSGVNIHAAHVFDIPRVEAGKEDPLDWAVLPSPLSTYLKHAFQGLAEDMNRGLPLFEYDTAEGERVAYSVSVQIHGERSIGINRHFWFLFVMTEVTPWLNLQEEVMNARRLESIGALASGVAHDFNNLIMAIQGHAEFLSLSRQDDEELVDTIRQIVRGCANGTALTRSLLGYARKQSLVMEELDLSELVTDAVDLCSRSYGSRYTFEMAEPFQVPDDYPGRPDLRINGCYSALSHCLLNILNNARDAMPKGGKIIINYSESQGHHTLVISDRGMGMDDETLKHVFEPFYTTKEAGAGTGLGLPMVHGIMQQHQGEIFIDSSLGEGAHVHMTWPKWSSTEQESFEEIEGKEVETHETGPQFLEVGVKRVFVIEDDASVLSSVSKLLTVSGYEVQAFDDATDVLEILQNASFDQWPSIIMVDYTMPGLNGVDFIKQGYEVIRERGRSPYLKLILMSGYPPEHFSEFTKEFKGAPIYLLQKPFSAETLIQILEARQRKFRRKITSRVSSRLEVKPQ